MFFSLFVRPAGSELSAGRFPPHSIPFLVPISQKRAKQDNPGPRQFSPLTLHTIQITAKPSPWHLPRVQCAAELLFSFFFCCAYTCAIWRSLVSPKRRRPSDSPACARARIATAADVSAVLAEARFFSFFFNFSFFLSPETLGCRLPYAHSGHPACRARWDPGTSPIIASRLYPPRRRNQMMPVTRCSPSRALMPYPHTAQARPNTCRPGPP